ncbi:MAG: hypothetical protein A2Z27_04040 [candidate division Zixibacteria bacterium RBG_16_50_21]|nr:MAG: hypothetical protein A2Z27_04040 [candidate division Zixibacteria bacterium RBG_16_50_21]
MRSKYFLSVGLLVFVLLALNCQRQADFGTSPVPVSKAAGEIVSLSPQPLVTVNFGPESMTFWPYTGIDFSGIPQDPLNFIVVGESDPQNIRSALLSLDGDRTAFGFPDAFPFNATWTEGVGGVQTTYAEPEGWIGGSVQLFSGPYDPLRFHLRLFDAGDWTLGGVHFEVLIPGTETHQVLSWELAEQLLAVDLLRSGLLDGAIPFVQSQQINPAPYKDIPAIIYNGLPVELRAAIGGPLGDVTDPVPILSDGKATIFNAAESFGFTPGKFKEFSVINFNQVIPKPFCSSGPFDYLLVSGPITLRQLVLVTPSGNYVSQFQAVGHLDLTPVNPLTNPPTPIGETYRAQVLEHHKSIITEQNSLTSNFQMQIEIPPSGPFHGKLVIKVKIGPNGPVQEQVEVICD